MTVRELQQLYYLNRLIERERERLDDLRAAAGLKSPVISDMPKAPGIRDKIGDIVPEIVDQERMIEGRIREYTETRDRLRAYIDAVPNARIRLILQTRFLDQKSWQEVADLIGGKETEYSVKQACYRYVDGRTCDPLPGLLSLLDEP